MSKVSIYIYIIYIIIRVIPTICGEMKNKNQAVRAKISAYLEIALSIFPGQLIEKYSKQLEACIELFVVDPNNSSLESIS